MNSILTASIEELEAIVQFNTLPEHLSLEGIEERKDFQKLFSHRLNPRFIAQTLLREKRGKPEEEGDASLKEKRLELKRKELELKEKKLDKTSQQLKAIWEVMKRVESKLDIVLSNSLRKEGGEI